MNQKLRKQVLTRDERICQTCLKQFEEMDLEVHHVIPRRKKGLDSLNNLFTQCLKCHNNIELERYTTTGLEMYKTIRLTEEVHELVGRHVRRKGENYGDIIERVFKEYDSLIKTKK